MKLEYKIRRFNFPQMSHDDPNQNWCVKIKYDVAAQARNSWKIILIWLRHITLVLTVVRQPWKFEKLWFIYSSFKRSECKLVIQMVIIPTFYDGMANTRIKKSCRRYIPCWRVVGHALWKDFLCCYPSARSSTIKWMVAKVNSTRWRHSKSTQHLHKKLTME